MDGEKKGKRQLSQVHKTPFLLSVNSCTGSPPTVHCPLITAFAFLPSSFFSFTWQQVKKHYLPHHHLPLCGPLSSLSFPFMLIKLSEIKSSRSQKWNKTLLYKKEGKNRASVSDYGRRQMAEEPWTGHKNKVLKRWGKVDVEWSRWLDNEQTVREKWCS